MICVIRGTIQKNPKIICLSLLTIIHIFSKIRSHGGPVEGEGLRLSIICNLPSFFLQSLDLPDIIFMREKGNLFFSTVYLRVCCVCVCQIVDIAAV